METPKEEKIIIDEDYLAERYLSKVYFRLEFEKLLPMLEFLREMNDKSIFTVMDYLISEISIPLKHEMSHKLRDWASTFDLENVHRMISFEQSRTSDLEADLSNLTQKVERFSMIFATLEDTREIKEKLSKWARIQTVKELEIQHNSLKDHVKEKFFEKNEIQQMFNENIRIMNEDYLNKRDFEKALVKQNEANEFYKNSIKSISVRLSAIDSEMISHNTSIKQNREDIELRETIEEVDRIREKFEYYWSYKHLKELYNKVIPAIQGFENNIKEFYKQMDQQKEMIRRFDEVIMTKAPKFSIDQLNKDLESYLKLTEYKESREAMKSEVEWINSRLDFLGNDLNEMNDRIIKEIKNAVK